MSVCYAEPTRVRSVRDLPEAQKPGDPGWYVNRDGYFVVPWGWNVYQSPIVQRRREWDAERIAGGRYNPGTIRIPVAKCSRCEILIGAGFNDTELYLRPLDFAKATKPKAPPKPWEYVPKIVWKYVCGSCATRYLDLSFGYCLISEGDYGGPHAEHLSTIRKAILDLKMKALEIELVPAWNAHVRDLKLAWEQVHGTLAGFPRRAALHTFSKVHEPTVLTFSTIYSRYLSLHEGVAS